MLYCLKLVLKYKKSPSKLTETQHSLIQKVVKYQTILRAASSDPSRWIPASIFSSWASEM